MHDPANLNLSLVANLITNQTLTQDMPVTFTARTGENGFGDDSPGSNDGPCQVCHTATAYHLYDANGACHYCSDACTDCHNHENGFQVVENICLQCHVTEDPCPTYTATFELWETIH